MLTESLASALLHLHEKDHTFHGDLKRANVVLASPTSSRGVLVDFEPSRTNAASQAPEVDEVGREG